MSEYRVGALFEVYRFEYFGVSVESQRQPDGFYQTWMTIDGVTVKLAQRTDQLEKEKSRAEIFIRAIISNAAKESGE